MASPRMIGTHNGMTVWLTDYSFEDDAAYWNTHAADAVRVETYAMFHAIEKLRDFANAKWAMPIQPIVVTGKASNAEVTTE